ALLASIYHWFPKITGRMFDERLGRIQFWSFYVAFNATYLPLFWAGMHGMRRRVAEVPPQTESVNIIATISSYLLALSVLLFLVNIVRSWVRGPGAEANPWQAHTLEWQVASPPPLENFRVPPVVVGDPYPYGVPGGRHVAAPETAS
ncbi:MAG: cbb3-type cytochrome c oxidase subunit I, partial [Chloroflexota bacterium]